MTSEVFQTRYLVAARYLRNCSHILEVGGCSTPITSFLQGAHESVTVVDPLVVPLQADTLNGRQCAVRHIPVRLEDYQTTGFENGFVALGMPMLPLPSVLAIMRRCEVSVLEFPPAFLDSCMMFKAVLESGYFDVTTRIVLDLSQNDLGDLADLNFAVRHLFVLKPRSAATADASLSKWLEVSNAYVRDARRYARRRTIRDRSALFLKDHFHAGYTFLKRLRDDGRAHRR